APYGDQILGSEGAGALCCSLIGDEVVECTLAIMLDRKHHVRVIHEIGRGGTHCAPLEAADVFRAVLLSGCPAVIVAHNHPSTDLNPSPDDLAVTNRLKAAAQILGIEFLDHLIVGANSWRSIESGKEGTG
ncbi:MAG: JAB domain-containing protein, partial [Vicinamibacterales bacterium]